MTLNIHDPYLAYYRQQLGHGVSSVYKGASYQRGHGIGSFLGGLFRTIFPLVKRGAATVGKEALKTGVNLLSDVVMDTTPPRQAANARMKEFTGNLKRKADSKIDSVLSGSGYKRKRQQVTPQSLQRLLAVHKSQTRKKKQTKRKGGKKKAVVRKIGDIFD